MKSKAECQHETASSFEASHFALHGLWPQPRGNQFCGVDPKLAALDDQHQWGQLPEPQLTVATKSDLAKAMPGTQSGLERHEWTKHGSCYPGANAETYFKDEVRLANAVNASPVPNESWLKRGSPQCPAVMACSSASSDAGSVAAGARSVGRRSCCRVSALR